VPSEAEADANVPLLADLLAIPTTDRYPAQTMGPELRKVRSLRALADQPFVLARRGPVLVLLEDAHWIDPTTRELIDAAIEPIGRRRVMLLVTCRPEFQNPWGSHSHVTTLTLNRLGRQQCADLIGQVAGGRQVPETITRAIIDRADGVPLFVEELTKAVLESGLLCETPGELVADGPLPPLAIPTTLQGSLLARLDRLSTTREVAQIGAAIGREFGYELLAAVAGLPEAGLQAALSQLEAAGLVFRRGNPPEAVYSFKHALVQDAAHGSLLRSSRRQLHAQIAEALETHFPEILEHQPELLAQHYAEAGLVEKSVAYWGKAGHSSAARSAMAEAAAQFHKGLEQLALLPDTPERQRQELEFCSRLGAALISVKGWGAPELGHVYVRAQELWERLGSPAEFFHLPFGQSFHHLARAEFDLAERFDENLLRLSHQRNDTAGLVLGYHSYGRTLFCRGRFASSRWHQEEALRLYDPISQHSLVGQAGFGPRVEIQGFLTLALLCLGFPDRALAQSNAAIAEARRLAHLPSLAVGLLLGTMLLSIVGEDAALNEGVDLLVAVTTEQGFPYWRAAGTILRGWPRSRMAM